MPENEPEPGWEQANLHKRRETMPDGRRYIIYYTFGSAEDPPQPNDKAEPRAEGLDV
jgi:hypothetical protein